MNLFNMLMAANEGGFWNAWPVLRTIALVIMAICAIFIIAVVMFQPGNSNGASAITGTTETFLGKNKKGTFEYKMRKLTIIAGIVFGVLCIIFAIIATNYPV